jgi:hypothetical protein
MLFDWLVIGQIVPMNPASSVRGPKYVVKTGKTPVLKADEARMLLDSIDTGTIVGIRDRALIGLMCYTFARVSAAVHMKVEDYYQNGKRFWFRLHEKSGKRHEVPANHNAEAYTEAYIQAAGVAGEKNNPLFRAVDKQRQITDRPLSRTDVLRMLKRRAHHAGLPVSISCHTFRASGQEPSEEGTRACPGAGGGHNWQASAYSPQTSWYYFPTTEGCQTYYKTAQEYREGLLYTGSTGTPIALDPTTGAVQAVDPATGETKWKFEMVSPPSSGLLATAGGLIFSGNREGYLMALDAKTGKPLWKFRTGGVVIAPPITYLLNGKQYVAVAAGDSLITFALR